MINAADYVAKVLRATETRIVAAKAHVCTAGITPDDVIAYETVRDELKKLVGATWEDIHRKRAEWSELYKQAVGGNDKGLAYDARVVVFHMQQIIDANKGEVSA